MGFVMSEASKVVELMDEIAQLRKTVAELKMDLARYQGTYLTPEPAHELTEVDCDGAKILVEYYYEPAGGDGWDEPRYGAVVAPQRMLINGRMVSIEDLHSMTNLDYLGDQILNSLL